MASNEGCGDSNVALGGVVYHRSHTHIYSLIPHMKRSRVRVPIGGQCVLLKISLRIKMFDFFFQIDKITV